MKHKISCVTAVVIGLMLVAAGSDRAVSAENAGTWDPRAAAQYLDKRESWWQPWYRSRIDHNTVCVSCHTVLPYAFARSALRAVIGETMPTSAERNMLGWVEKRVNDWSEVLPYYSEQRGVGKAAQSRSTESVLNALVLASYDSRERQVRPVTRIAFNNAWALQEASGGWNWQDFKLGPWENANSGYLGATLLLLAVKSLPDDFATAPENKPHVKRLESFLKQGYSSQPLINRIYVLWASSTSPRVLDRHQRRALLDELRGLQQADGGWRNAGMDPTERKDHSEAPRQSDGYVTALVVLALRASGARAKDPMLSRGKQWLLTHQQADGSWSASSMNLVRDPESDAGPFMTDAATGYAALALLFRGPREK